MKKLILAALVAALSLAGLAQAENTALWANYTAAKAEAKSALADLENGSTDTAVLDQALAGYTKSAAAAAALDRKDIQAWHLQNRAYASITWFKNAGYSEHTAAVAAMPASKEKPGAVQAARDAIRPSFERIEAQASADLNAALETGYEAASFLETVKSNRSFLNWVRNFLDKK